MVGVGALAGVLVAGLVLPVTGALGLAARGSAEASEELPSELVTQPQPQRSVVLDAAGNVMTTFFEQNRVYVPLDQVSPVMISALLAIEDARFYEHGPIDLQGTSRSAIRNIASGEITGGGSTLTQQYVKNVLFEQATTPEEQAQAKAPNLAARSASSGWRSRGAPVHQGRDPRALHEHPLLRRRRPWHRGRGRHYYSVAPPSSRCPRPR